MTDFFWNSIGSAFFVLALATAIYIFAAAIAYGKRR